mmetsp:Transcript_6569/g.18433  ORF Transcript_6569/g.18433 Transcript_6569/m.18433 type:complete len:278 (-) Transcript_6569:205-1038(-)
MASERVEGHQVSEVNRDIATLRASAPLVQAAMSLQVRALPAADDAAILDSDAGVTKKIISFIRHGEGDHNVAQRLWRARPDWDGVSEPYTPANDPDNRYLDPSLTDKGRQQARDLRPRTAVMMKTPVELMVVSPMRRATQTALIAFEPHLGEGLKVLAHELCHERAGAHTCDKRVGKTSLAAEFPGVDYSLIGEEDPYWSSGRETESEVSTRAGQFLEWLATRPEKRIVVASHSAWLLATFNAAMDATDAESQWFGTGEMRTVEVSFSATRSRCVIS